MVTSNDCLKKYGSPIDDEGTPTVNEGSAFEMKWMSRQKIPLEIIQEIRAFPTVIYCNVDLIAPLTIALRNVAQRGLGGQIKTFDGCFNVRKKRGLSSLSLHSWGIAIDINATWNQLGKEPTMSKELVQCFKDAGFDWGGDWKRKDGMHFQLSKI